MNKKIMKKIKEEKKKILDKYLVTPDPSISMPTKTEIKTEIKTMTTTEKILEECFGDGKTPVKYDKFDSVSKRARKGEPEDHKEIRELLKNMTIARKAIRKKHPEGKEFVEGTMKCPLCKNGTRWYMISDHYNGHIHSKCTTEDCIQWCE